jgi:hypothetical protein
MPSSRRSSPPADQHGLLGVVHRQIRRRSPRRTACRCARSDRARRDRRLPGSAGGVRRATNHEAGGPGSDGGAAVSQCAGAAEADTTVPVTLLRSGRELVLDVTVSAADVLSPRRGRLDRAGQRSYPAATRDAHDPAAARQRVSMNQLLRAGPSPGPAPTLLSPRRSIAGRLTGGRRRGGARLARARRALLGPCSLLNPSDDGDATSTSAAQCGTSPSCRRTEQSSDYKNNSEEACNKAVREGPATLTIPLREDRARAARAFTASRRPLQRLSPGGADRDARSARVTVWTACRRLGCGAAARSGRLLVMARCPGGGAPPEAERLATVVGALDFVPPRTARSTATSPT